MARRGRPRKKGAKRHPNGSVYRHGKKPKTLSGVKYWQNLKDKERAARDPRLGSVGGKLELLGPEKGGITQFERLAGERWAMVVNSWRRRCVSSPNPNPPAANMEAPTGKAVEADPFHQDEIEEERDRSARARYQAAVGVVMRLPHGRLIRDSLDVIFVLEESLPKGRMPLLRQGLRCLTRHFGLIGS